MPALKSAKTARPDPSIGSFTPSGSWWPGDHTPHEIHHRITDLARRLSREQIPPSLAATILRQELPSLADESCFSLWDRLDRLALWPNSPTSSSALEFLKRSAITRR